MATPLAKFHSLVKEKDFSLESIRLSCQPLSGFILITLPLQMIRVRSSRPKEKEESHDIRTMKAGLADSYSLTYVVSNLLGRKWLQMKLILPFRAMPERAKCMSHVNRPRGLDKYP